MLRDEQLEAAIDAVGRQRVFVRAKQYGWNQWDLPPKWVWWYIVGELEIEES